MPEIARDGFRAGALAKDGILHRIGDAMRSLVEENFKGFRSLIARVALDTVTRSGFECSVAPVDPAEAVTSTRMRSLGQLV